MTRQPSEREKRLVFSFPPMVRHVYMAREVAKTERLWSLTDDRGWKLCADETGAKGVPIWSHEDYAAACAIGTWDGCRPRAIMIDDWLRKWEPGLIRDGLKVALCPTPDAMGILIDAVTFNDIIRSMWHAAKRNGNSSSKV